MLIFIKLVLKSPIKKQNLSTLFSLSRNRVKYFELKSTIGIRAFINGKTMIQNVTVKMYGPVKY